MNAQLTFKREPVYATNPEAIKLDGLNAYCSMLNVNPAMCQTYTREMIGIVVKNYSFAYHIGGHHVAIISGNLETLAQITGNFGDWK